jgi:hypothetical protein
MICFCFFSESSGKIEIRSWDLLDDLILLKEFVDDILTLVLEVLFGLIPLEELPLRRLAKTWVEGIGAVEMLTSAGLGVVDIFTSGKIFLGWAVSEISDI